MGFLVLPKPDKRCSTEVAGRMMQLIREKLQKDDFHCYQGELRGPDKPPIIVRPNLGYLSSLPHTAIKERCATCVLLILTDLTEMHIQSLEVDMWPGM